MDEIIMSTGSNESPTVHKEFITIKINNNNNNTG
jgi:hypothetical protein